MDNQELAYYENERRSPKIIRWIFIVCAFALALFYLANAVLGLIGAVHYLSLADNELQGSAPFYQYAESGLVDLVNGLIDLIAAAMGVLLGLELLRTFKGTRPFFKGALALGLVIGVASLLTSLLSELVRAIIASQQGTAYDGFTPLMIAYWAFLVVGIALFLAGLILLKKEKNVGFILAAAAFFSSLMALILHLVSALQEFNYNLEEAALLNQEINGETLLNFIIAMALTVTLLGLIAAGSAIFFISFYKGLKVDYERTSYDEEMASDKPAKDEPKPEPVSVEKKPEPTPEAVASPAPEKTEPAKEEPLEEAKPAEKPIETPLPASEEKKPEEKPIEVVKVPTATEEATPSVSLNAEQAKLNILMGYKTLLEEGYLTKEEFEKKKKELL